MAEKMLRPPILISLVWMLIVLESNCGGGASTSTPPPPSLSIITGSLVDGMVTFPYSQTIQASGGVAPFSWSVSSGSLPHSLTLGSSSTNSANISGTADTAQTATFAIQVKDAKNQTAAQSYTLKINNTGLAQVQTATGQVPAGMIEIRGVAAGPFNPLSWQQNTLNWVPDVRTPMLAPLPGLYQNIYSPWPLQQPNGWLLFYGGWDGTATSNDRVYNLSTPDFLSFGSRSLVIDHGAFMHVNNVNVTQLSDGSMHMICTVLIDPNDLDKPAYFSSPDGQTWNGSPEPYSAQLSDRVSIPDDPIYATNDYNGGNVLLWDNNAWTLYYSNGVFGGNNGKVYRATSTSIPQFHSAGSALNTSHYANDVKKFQVAGKNWYVMALYIERVATDPNPPTFSYSLSNDGITFGPEFTLFGGAYPEDQFVTTPAFVTSGSSILGVLYGANPVDVLNAADQIFARWLQKKVVITDSSGVQYTSQIGYGPDRQWFQSPASGSIQGTITVYAEDGITPLARGSVNVSGENAYQLALSGGQ